jgi:MFS superfamily sulfate permease-like transporter
MKRTLRYYRIIWLKHDLPAGLSVFLVALPLCLGIALASGAPLYAGLLSGIIGGLIVSMLSGSQLAVSGPAAGLTVIVASAIVSLGDYRLFLLSVIIAGVIQIVLGLLKLGTVASYFPSSVIKGMLAAIGIILISKQIPVALGYDHPDFWTSDFVSLFSSNHFKGNLNNINQHISRGAIFIFLFSVLIYIILKQPFAKKINSIPKPLIIVVVGIIINIIFGNSSLFSLKETQLVNIPGHLFSQINFPDLSALFSNSSVWIFGLKIALLASLETLLCIEAIDKLDKRNRITPLNRELVAQGIGNMACGFLGAIPITAVVVRGAANVDAGGRTNLSSFTHGIFLLCTILIIPSLINKIPYASLSAILIITGFNLARPKLFRNMFSLGPKQFIPFALTIIVILLTDLLIGVSIGLFISGYFIIQNNFRAEYKIFRKKEMGLETFYIKLNSNVTFLNKVKLQKSLDEIPEYSVLTIDGTECNFIDYDILEIISEYCNKAHERHIELHLNGIEEVNITSVH